MAFPALHFDGGVATLSRGVASAEEVISDDTDDSSDTSEDSDQTSGDDTESDDASVDSADDFSSDDAGTSDSDDDSCNSDGTCAETIPFSSRSYEEPSCNIWVNMETIRKGESIMVHWNSQYAHRASLTNFGSVGLEGSRVSDALYDDTTFRLSVRGDWGVAQCSVKVEVLDDVSVRHDWRSDDSWDEPSCWIHASPVEYREDLYGATMLTWDSQGATSAEILDVGFVSLRGSRIVYGDLSFEMSVYGEQGVAYCATEGEFIAPPPPEIPPLYPPYAEPYVFVPAQHVALTQVPYTGDYGPFGTAMYWFSIIFSATVGVVLLAYFKRDIFSFAKVELTFLIARKGFFQRNNKCAVDHRALDFTPVRVLLG
jgi:hypothetical protein